METKTNIYHEGNSRLYTLDEVSTCPRCKHSIKPVQLYGYAYRKNTDVSNIFDVSLLYLCRACNDTFLVQYENVAFNSMSSTFSQGTINTISPNKFIEEKFDKLIEDTSKSFVKIYNQALNAECSGLDQIAGIGYRKALEFLIKDFLILKNSDKKESIEKSQLGQCITNFVDNPQLKVAASRATWLGNDQTHYIQKFDDKDISDLKRLIRLTVHWISMILETEEAATIEPKK